MKSWKIRMVLLMGTISIVGIVLVQIYWVRQAFDTRNRQLRQTISIALINVANKMAEFNGGALPNANPVIQLSGASYIVNVNDVIDAGVLEHYLKSELHYRGLNLDFEYAIYDCSSDSMVYGNYVSTSESDKPEKPSGTFPRLDKYTYYFGIHFPYFSGYLLNSMRIWILSSVILLAVIVFFSYAMFIIFRQKRLAEVQKDFLDNMTHEFKTPISTISVAADVLSRPDIVQNPQKLFTYASIIRSENLRLQEQVEKILQLATLDRTSIRLHPGKIDLHELIGNLIKNSEPNLTPRNGKIETHLHAEKFNVTADRVHLTNVLFNLLDNAVKYNRREPLIVLATGSDAKQLTLTVRDNGIGIPPEYRKKIFDKFFRVPTGNVHDAKGFGLGLSYVKSIADAHGWDLMVTSDVSTGTEFTIKMNIDTSD
jgi:two-component system phosphate regulon sensor histidine kinase PhoR